MEKVQNPRNSVHWESNIPVMQLFNDEETRENIRKIFCAKMRNVELRISRKEVGMASLRYSPGIFLE
jgi:hypothetical protein